MKKLSIAAAFLLLFAFGIFSTAGVNLTYGHKMNSMDMSEHNPCSFMGEIGICLMSPLAHIKHFQNMFLAALPNTTLFVLASLLAVLAIIALRQRIVLFTELQKRLSAVLLNILGPPRFQYEKTEIVENSNLKSFTKRNPRLYE